MTTRTALLSSRALPASPPLRRRATAAWMPYPMRSLGAGHGKQGNTGYSLSGSTRPRARHLRMRIEECKREREEFFCCCSNTRNKKRRGQQRSLSLSLSAPLSLENPLSPASQRQEEIDRGNRPSSAERKNGVVAVQTRGREKTEKKKQCLPLRQVHFRPLSSAGSAPPAPPRASCAATPRPARLPAPAGAAAPSPGTGA